MRYVKALPQKNPSIIRIGSVLRSPEGHVTVTDMYVGTLLGETWIEYEGQLADGTPIEEKMTWSELRKVFY